MHTRGNKRHEQRADKGDSNRTEDIVNPHEGGLNRNTHNGAARTKDAEGNRSHGKNGEHGNEQEVNLIGDDAIEQLFHLCLHGGDENHREYGGSIRGKPHGYPVNGEGLTGCHDFRHRRVQHDAGNEHRDHGVGTELLRSRICNRHGQEVEPCVTNKGEQLE